MRILVTGRGTSGSWQIRGVQLGAAIGATVEPNATKPKGYDVAVVVKRCPPDLLHRIRQAATPIVWDIVDSFPQPYGNLWDRDRCMEWLRAKVAELQPVAIVAATQAMAADLIEFGLPVLALPHHARPGQRYYPLRETVRTVGYEGGEQYLGRWRGVLERECAARGWTFHVNHSEFADLDIVVALREVTGYAPRHWKSGVKLANAMGASRPAIVNREAGCMEIAHSGQPFADTEPELAVAFDRLTDPGQRLRLIAGYQPPMLEDIAERYKAWLERLPLKS